uniref:Uncharacterized protein n=1 Tax=Rhizophora mucronata TaxID=61149 RepID=A0A2P2PYC4_RHIMU
MVTINHLHFICYFPLGLQYEIL